MPHHVLAPAFPIIVLLLMAASASGQAPGKWPPDSLTNTQVIARTTSTTQVWGTMRNFAASLGVTCQYCHVGAADAPLERIDYVTDVRRPKLIARQMMLMVQEINRRLDTIPGGSRQAVTCNTCHRGVARPVPLSRLMTDTVLAAGASIALRRYLTIRDRYYGRDSYDFGEPSLNSAAFAAARGGRIDDALALLAFNETLFPKSAALSIVRGNVLLMRSDTTAAAEAFRQALQYDPTNTEARDRLRTIGRP